ncbi:MAG TPA: HAMP domain-containing histidine kinase [Candidatus Bacteroides avicola]|uniref:histidine kinase n=1 Tax=Candidatus Bacteroides avicola TaxID=2838468 RepID=A0A9D2HUV1_9BACE|nr:HAMP domain-containing histidine kinase [Candidatus Bacteroides avicola]
MKDDFTNNITHELKTPIAVAYAANDALLNFGADADAAKRNRYLHICQEQLKLLGGLVEQILSLSMERRRTFRLHPTTFAVGEAIAPLIEQHRLKADKSVDIALHITPPDLTVTADRTHFCNIVSNLLDNAIKYSPKKAEVEITSHKQEMYTVISVRDHGIGIPHDKLPRVFDKFYRVPTGNRHEVKGYGLGLFYVKTMVEKHGGTVEAHSETGQGSEFIIKLSRMEDEE